MTRIVHAAAVERIVGIGRRPVDRLLHRGERHAVGFKIGELRFGIDEPGVKIPRAEIAAQTCDDTVSIFINQNAAVATIDKAIALHNHISAGCRNGRARQTIWVDPAANKRGWAKRVPVGITRNADRHGAQDGRCIVKSLIFRTIIATFEIRFDTVRQFVVQQRHRIIAVLAANQRVAEYGVITHRRGWRFSVTRTNAVAEIHAATGECAWLQIEVVVVYRCPAVG